MKKIAFIGAGSFGFTRALVRDILTFPAFSDCTIALMDIDNERLSYIKRAVEKIIAAGNYPAKVSATTDRIEALKGADGVVCTILTGAVNIWRYDIEIPKKYGIDICIGDTRGPSGIFRALRTIPVMLDICRDIERYCPDAVFLNYTNPMAMLCRAMQGVSKIKVTGLCHSVQETAEMLAEWVGAPKDKISYLCAGINHQAWYLNIKWDGRDMYPLIRQAMENPEIYKSDMVRNDLFLHFGYYVTESSRHSSEYYSWFRKRPDLLDRYFTKKEGRNPGLHALLLNYYLRREDSWRDDISNWLNNGQIDLERGHEYASYIFNAIFGDNTIYRFNGNVRNFGLIDNLPEGCCVEVPVVASKQGFEPIHVGPLPDHLAIITNVNARCEELAVEAAIEGDAQKVFHAVCMDPLTSAVLSLPEIREMVKEMFEVNKQYLPQFRHTL